MRPIESMHVYERYTAEVQQFAQKIDEMEQPEEIVVKNWKTFISIFLLVWRRQTFFSYRYIICQTSWVHKDNVWQFLVVLIRCFFWCNVQGSTEILRYTPQKSNIRYQKWPYFEAVSSPFPRPIILGPSSR